MGNGWKLDASLMGAELDLDRILKGSKCRMDRRFIKA